MIVQRAPAGRARKMRYTIRMRRPFRSPARRPCAAVLSASAACRPSVSSSDHRDKLNNVVLWRDRYTSTPLPEHSPEVQLPRIANSHIFFGMRCAARGLSAAHYGRFLPGLGPFAFASGLFSRLTCTTQPRRLSADNPARAAASEVCPNRRGPEPWYPALRQAPCRRWGPGGPKDMILNTLTATS